MVRPSRRRSATPLPESRWDDGSDDGEGGIDWETGGWQDPGNDVGGDAYELNTEGGQSVIHAHGNAGATETIDPTLGNVHTLTLDADLTLTLGAPVGTGAATLELRIEQDGTGGWDITWPGSVSVLGTLDTTASTESIVILETLDGGTSWVAVVVGGGGATTAADVSIADAGGYYTGTDVEAALQEIGAGGIGGGTGYHYEILMASGSADPLLTSDGLDYLYVLVPD